MRGRQRQENEKRLFAIGLGEAESFRKKSLREGREIDARFADRDMLAVRIIERNRAHVVAVRQPAKPVEAVSRRRPMRRDMAQMPFAD
jgi:hypothetical protein